MSLKICVSIADKDLAKVKSILEKFDFCELRLDLIKPDINEIKGLIKKNRNVIVTCRENAGVDRIQYLIEAIKSKPKYLDIEFETELKIKRTLIDLCEKHGVKRIHSYHNFEYTPDFKNLITIAENEYSSFKPAIIKIATYVNKENDNITLLSLLSSKIPLVVLGMGDLGRKTRLIAPLLGSKFTFASIDNKPSAPGQLDYFAMKDFYNKLENILQ